ncbi:MAG: zf-HC2 domain-containing protein [Planctomycetes bacterium]|nr:zf-HC2 domain-containing protein [Planctomycetota bacterium]
MKREFELSTDLLRRVLKSDSTAIAEGCLEPEFLALAVEDGLDAAERAMVMEHLSACPECARVVVWTREADRMQHGPRKWRFLVPIATVMVVVAGFAWLRGCSVEESGRSQLSVLESVCQVLRASGDKGLQDLMLFDFVELSSMDDPAMRSEQALSHLGPRGTILDDRPKFRLRLPVDQVASLSVADARGVEVLTVEMTGRVDGKTQEMPFPQDRPPLPRDADYVVIAHTLRRDLPAITRAFRVASAQEGAEFRRVTAIIEREAPADAELLIGHLALRQGFLEEAWNYAERARAANPDSVLARETHAAVGRRLGTQ